MANLLSWAGNAVKRVENTVNNDVVKPIQRDVVAPVAHVAATGAQKAQAVAAQVNPLDSGRTYSSVMQHGAAYAPNPLGSILQQATHNGLTNFAGNNLVKPLAQFPLDASSQIYNRIAAPILHTPKLTPTQVSPISGVSKDVGATGSLHQTIGSGIQTGLTLASGGLAKGIETSAAKIVPKAAPALVKSLAPRVVSNAAIGAGFNASAAASQGAKPQDIAKAAALGAGLGAAVPIAGASAKPLASATSRVIVKAADKTAPAVKQATSLTPRVTANDQLTLQDLSNHLSGTKKLQPKAYSNTITQARVIGQKHGVNLATGAPLDRLNKVNSILDKVKTENRSISEGGFAKIPGKVPQEGPISKPGQSAGINKGVSPVAPPNEQFPVSTVKPISNRVGAYTPPNQIQEAPSAPSVLKTSSSHGAPQGTPKVQAPQELPAPPKSTSGLQNSASSPNNPTKVSSGQVQTIDKVMANTMGTTPEQKAANRIAEGNKQINAADQQASRILNISPVKARNLRLKGNIPPELNKVVNEPLSRMGKQIADMPAATPNVSDLPPMENLPTASKLFSSKVNALDKINTQSSRELAQRMRNIEADKADMRAKWMNQIPTVQKLNRKETSNLFDVVQRQGKAMNPKVAQAVKEWRKLTPQVHHEGTLQGLLIGERKNYIPHHYNMNGIAKNTSAYDNAIQHLIDTNRIDHNSAVDLFKNMQAESAKYPNRFGHFENARLGNMPGYEKTQKALGDYIEGAASRTAEARHFGLDSGIAARLLTNIRMEGGDVTSAQKAVANYLHSPERGTGAKTLQNIRGVFGTARLGKAVISHAGQTSNTAVDSGIGNTAKGWAQFLTRNKKGADFISRTGVTNPQLLHSYQDQYTSVKGLMSRATAPGLNQMMKVNRSVTALAYRSYGHHLAESGNVSELRKLGATGDIAKRLTPEQEIQVARGGVDRTMFNPNKSTTPIFAETTAGKLVGQYRTAYAYKQTGFIYDRVIKEARNGNLKPLARFLGIAAPVGYGTIALKNKISGNKEGAGGIGMDAAGALGGIPGEIALELGRYGKRDLTKSIAGEVAPLAGEAVTAAENAQKALNGQAAPLGREALGMIPIVGSRISKAVLPPKTGPNAPAAKPTGIPTTLSAKGKKVQQNQRELKANNPNELARWQGMTAKARSNVQTANPSKYVRDQQLQVQADQAAGNTVQAFKDTQSIAKTQISANYSKDTVQAYGLTSTQFKEYLMSAPSSTVSQLQQYDKQLVQSGLQSSTKFTSAVAKATGYKSLVASSSKSTGSKKSSSTKLTGSSLAAVTKATKTSVPKAPKAPKFSVKGASTKYKSPKISTYKVAKVATPNLKKLLKTA